MKRGISLAIAMIMTVSLFSACGGQGTGNGGSADGVITDPSKIVKKDWKVKEYDPPVEATIVGQDYPYVTFPEGQTRNDNAWTRAYEKELGIKLNYAWVVDGSQYAQKIELSLASGEMPDMVQVNATQLQSLVENDMIADLSEAYLAYISDDARAVIEEAGPYAIDTATFNGKLMAIPFNQTMLEGAMSVLWIRQDWLDKLGLKMPTSYEELEKVMIAFGNNDPDGNGKKDTYCLTLTKDSFNLGYAIESDGIFNAFGGYSNLWYKKGGKIVYGGIQPEMKKGLESYQKLYKEGALNPEFNTVDFSKVTEAVVNDKVGVIFRDYYAPGSMLQSMVAATGKTDVWRCIEIPKSGGGTIVNGYDTAPTGYYVVKKGYSNPEVLVKLVNMFVEEFYINGTDLDRYYTFIQNKEGNNPLWIVSPFNIYRSYNNVLNFRNLEKYVLEGDKAAMDKVTYLGRNFYNSGLNFNKKVGNKEDWMGGWFWWAMTCPENEYASLRVISKIIDEKRYLPNQFNGMLSTEVAEKMGFLYQKQAQVFQKIIVGAEPIESFDNFVDEWRVNGGDLATEEMNAWYNERPPVEKNVFLSDYQK